MFAKVMQAPANVWTWLNVAWVTFFTAMGFANLYVAYNYSLETWVDFKTIWMLVITFVFIIAQGIYLSRYMKPDTEKTLSNDEIVKDEV
jgi:intracellular septation protein